LHGYPFYNSKVNEHYAYNTVSMQVKIIFKFLQQKSHGNGKWQRRPELVTNIFGIFINFVKKTLQISLK